MTIMIGRVGRTLITKYLKSGISNDLEGYDVIGVGGSRRRVEGVLTY